MENENNKPNLDFISTSKHVSSENEDLFEDVKECLSKWLEANNN